MNYLEFIFGDDPYISILQFIILILSCVILYFVYGESSKLTDLKSQIGEIEMVCPESKDCPDLVCADNELECPSCPACPDCVLDGSGSGSTTCPQCPDVTCPSVLDIVDGLFPGRNQGVTVTGKYFPVNAMEEGVLLPAYSNFSNLADAGSNMRMEGTTATPSQTMGANPTIPTATTIQPPIAPGGGIMGSAPGANNPQMNPGAMPQLSTIGALTSEQVPIGGGE
jgi:hypothetical protein